MYNPGYQERITPKRTIILLKNQINEKKEKIKKREEKTFSLDRHVAWESSSDKVVTYDSMEVSRKHKSLPAPEETGLTLCNTNGVIVNEDTSERH
jgi:hypothetical protein